MIRFNGYPFLEKEDHAFHVAGTQGLRCLLCHFHPNHAVCTVSKVMRKDLHVMPASGICVRDIGESHETRGLHVSLTDTEQIMLDTDVKGFPVVSADSERLLLGYIGRAEIRYVLGACAGFPGTNLCISLN